MKHLLFFTFGILIVFAFMGCAKNPVEPKNNPQPIATSNNIQIMTRSFPVTISNTNQNSIFSIPGIKNDCLNGISAVKVYIQYPGLAGMGWLSLPYTINHSDGSQTTIQYSINKDKLMIQSNSTGKIGMLNFQAHVVIINK